MASGQSLRQVANLQTVMAEGLTAARRLFAALDVRAADPRPARRAGALPAGQATVRLEDVTFSYGDEAPVLDGLSAWRPRAARPSRWSAPPAAARPRCST